MSSETFQHFFFGGAQDMGPLLILGIVLMGGALGGWIAKSLHVPAITGNILAGSILGLTLFHEVHVAQALQPLSTFAISLISVSAGGHFSYRRVHNALRRILSIAFFESLAGVFLVVTVLLVMQADWKLALIMGCLAAGTAPATTLAIIREERAKGPFVKTLLAVVSVDSSLCILLFAFVHNLLADYYMSGRDQFELSTGLIHTAWILLGSIALGSGLGLIASRLFELPKYHNFSTMAVTILFAAGTSMYLGLSALLTCLILGAFLGNASRESERQLRALEPIEPLLYTAFFTLAGVSLHFDLLAQAGLLCVIYLLARAIGKGAGAYLGATISGCSRRITNSIPLGFVPQAGVALGLIVILEGDSRIPSEFSTLVSTLVLAAVTINEIIGPFFTRAALRRADESGLDRPRLVEFLQEEFILPNLEAEDKWDALKKLTNFYARTHQADPTTRAKLLESVTEREDESSTAIGMGIAIPHARVSTSHEIEGVLALCPKGVDFDAPDGLPVRLIVMIVTPKEHEQRHLDVLASLTSMISNRRVRNRLLGAADANEAWEIIESQESRSYNYFLEDDYTNERGQPSASAR